MCEENTIFCEEPKLKGNLIVSYVYLDKIERKRFAESRHEYLIEQVQATNGYTVNKNKISVPLYFENPTSYLVFVVQLDKNVDGSLLNNEHQWDNYTINGSNPVLKGLLKFGGRDRNLPMDGNYYNFVQPYQHGFDIPSNGVNIYSFALYPSQFQPSGQFNLSGLEENKLILELDDAINNNPARVKVYAVSYNVLRYMSGMAGLAFYGD